jgi:hypothetical protein
MRKLAGTVIALFVLGALTSACNSPGSQGGNDPAIDSAGTYASDLTFLREYVPDVVELVNATGTARIALSGKYQGRVMTSTAGGNSGDSFGWINYDLLRSKMVLAQFNPVGGEERLWVGPEGGQYSFYFSPGDSFQIANWQVPYLVDTVTYELVDREENAVSFTKASTLTNYAGAKFNIEIKRKVRLLSDDSLRSKTGVNFQGIQHVAYETVNQIRNTGSRQWKKEDGLLSIWLLSMMKPSDETVAIIPFHPAADIDSLITDNYFGAVPKDRLVRKDSVLILKCDGKFRSKVGVSPRVAKPYAASYDYERNVFTILFFSVDRDGLYVNSKWEIQDNPYEGDVVNSYNDGPLDDGGQLGPFYELESSSPARELKPGEILEHRQLVVHAQGDFQQMKELAAGLLGVNLSEIKLP